MTEYQEVSAYPRLLSQIFHWDNVRHSLRWQPRPCWVLMYNPSLYTGRNHSNKSFVKIYRDLLFQAGHTLFPGSTKIILTATKRMEYAFNQKLYIWKSICIFFSDWKLFIHHTKFYNWSFDCGETLIKCCRIFLFHRIIWKQTEKKITSLNKIINRKINKCYQ